METNRAMVKTFLEAWCTREYTRGDRMAALDLFGARLRPLTVGRSASLELVAS